MHTLGICKYFLNIHYTSSEIIFSQDGHKIHFDYQRLSKRKVCL